MRSLLLKLITLICILLLVSGCWSSNEIEDLSLYLAMAIDKGKPSKIERTIDKKNGDFPSKDSISMTVQIAPPQSVKNTESGPNKLYHNVTQTGDSLFEILREFALRQNRPVIAHHLKVIVISKALIEELQMNEFLDFMFKDNDIRPNCILFITTGTAADTISFGDSGILPAMYLKNLIGNQKRSNRIIPAVTLTDVNAHFQGKQSFVLQNIITADNTIKFAGAGIVNGKTGKWAGYLNESDIIALNWIKNDVSGGLIKSYNENDEVITLEITSAKSKIKSSVANGKISFKVSIETEGRLIENWDMEKLGSDPSYIKDVEKRFEETMRGKLEGLMKKLQEEYKVDVADFGKTLKQQHYKVWKGLKDDWDEEFSGSKVEFDIKLAITNFGASMQ